MPDRIPAIKLVLLPKDTNAYGTIFGGVILSQHRPGFGRGSPQDGAASAT